ncbi:MAG: hypothetical protein K2W95_15600 [Candidatus Obscuribacterales bacterium]|nr:hypothetical protein [Candidatus Obscuribacterales bacterium]
MNRILPLMFACLLCAPVSAAPSHRGGAGGGGAGKHIHVSQQNVVSIPGRPGNAGDGGQSGPGGRGGDGGSICYWIGPGTDLGKKEGCGYVLVLPGEKGKDDGTAGRGARFSDGEKAAVKLKVDPSTKDLIIDMPNGTVATVNREQLDLLLKYHH